jgi:hypothetical protein
MYINDQVHALMVNELARRERRPGATIAPEYYFQYFGPRRFVDLTRFEDEHLTVFEAKTQVWDLGETIRSLRHAGQVLPLYEAAYKDRPISTTDVRLVLLATEENAELVMDNLPTFSAVFGNGRRPGPDGVSYGLSLLDPLDGESCRTKVLSIGRLPEPRLAMLLGRLAPYADKSAFERAWWERRRNREEGGRIPILHGRG